VKLVNFFSTHGSLVFGRSGDVLSRFFQYLFQINGGKELQVILNLWSCSAKWKKIQEEGFLKLGFIDFFKEVLSYGNFEITEEKEFIPEVIEPTSLFQSGHRKMSGSEQEYDDNDIVNISFERTERERRRLKC
jgi:hypothetical protein